MKFISQKEQELLDYPILINKPRIVKIKETKTETPTIKSLVFQDKTCSTATPGQFVMVWIPSVDEIPISLSTMDSHDRSAITVKRVGEASSALHNLKAGEVIGIRGPYGRSFTPITGRVMIVGGGIGVAPLAPLAEKLAKHTNVITFVIGAATRNELLFLNRIRRSLSEIDAEIVAATEDGSYGSRGLATDTAEQTIETQKFDTIYTCGPEQMMQKTLQLAEQHKTNLQASLERYMRCGVGICGSCCIGKYRVCRDGPVFSVEQLKEVKGEFGFFKRDAYGRRTSI